MLWSEHRVLAAKVQQVSHGIFEVALVLAQLPIDPTQHGVLAVGVVVAELSFGTLVTGSNHRDARREQHGRHQVAHRLSALSKNFCVNLFTLATVVKRVVVVCAVAVAFAILLVVLHVVAHQIVQREAVVRGYKVHRAERANWAINHVARARQASC